MFFLLQTIIEKYQISKSRAPLPHFRNPFVQCSMIIENRFLQSCNSANNLRSSNRVDIDEVIKEANDLLNKLHTLEVSFNFLSKA